MATLKFYDSAFPPNNPPAADGVCGYIGGDTPHIWTLSDWNSQKVRYRLPIYVRSNPPGPGAAADVASAVARLKVIGAPKGTLVAWDMETAADASYIMAVYDDLKAAGYKLIVYGSQSSVLGNKNPDGLYWGAQWTNVPHLAVLNQMTQWADFGAYDVSLAEATLPFWDTKLPPPPPNPYPLLSEGSTGAAVMTLQLRLTAWGFKTAPDGDFGSGTLAALELFQGSIMLMQPPSGKTDVATWKALLATPPPPPATYGRPLNLTARPGRTSVRLAWSAPGTPGLPAPAEYQVYVYEGTVANVHTLVPSYPRHLGAVLSYQGGSLKKGVRYTAHVVASGSDLTHIRPFTYASVTFTTG